MGSKLHTQLTLLFPLLVKLYLPVLVLLLIVAGVSLQTKIPVSDFTRDPTAILGVHPFLGLLSNLGVLLWCATAAICFWSAAFLNHRKQRPALRDFFLLSGLLTLVLLLDDFFRLHDWVFPTVLHARQEVVYSAYLLMLLAYLLWFRRLLLRVEAALLLVLALGFFGLSIVLDVVVEGVLPWDWQFLLEDGSKLFGIASWSGFFVSTCFRASTSVNPD